MGTVHQNITLALPLNILMQAKTLAIEKGVSLSKLLAQLIQDRVKQARRYRAASMEETRLLRDGLDLGTKGRIGWGRDELHAR